MKQDVFGGREAGQYGASVVAVCVQAEGEITLAGRAESGLPQPRVFILAALNRAASFRLSRARRVRRCPFASDLPFKRRIR